MQLQALTKQQRKIIRAWCMYDWANSGFATSGIAAILPVYFVFLFKDALGNEAIFLGISFTGSSMWGLATAVSTGIVALTSPILGVIADRVAIKKTLLWIYTITGCLFTVLSFFSVYSPSPWAWLLGTFLIGNVGFAGSLVFYNSLLPHITPHRHLLDEVSSKGYAYGYIGGGLLLLIHLILVLLTSGSEYADLVTRLSLGSIGVWWFLWAIWTLKVVPEPLIQNPVKGLKPISALKLSFSELSKTFSELRKFKVILTYLGVYLLFNDGIQTVMAIAGAFAADTLGIPLTFNMLTILIIQFVAAFGAIIFSRLAKATSTKKALSVSLVGWSMIVLLGVGFAPLEPSSHKDYDYKLTYDQSLNLYSIESKPELSDSKMDRSWEKQIENIVVAETRMISIEDASELQHLVGQFSSYSLSIRDGPLPSSGTYQIIGINHPANLGEGPFDWWPLAVREAIWQPLGMAVGYQWLLLGVLVGLVMGGSQALARSLFAQIAPQAKSVEFFSFFGFMGRASSVFGPMIYIAVTGVFDTRTAIVSILIIIILGTIGLRWVNVEEGIKVAREEDKRLSSPVN